MSVNAYWKPIKPKKGKSLDIGIKRILARRYLDHDGSLSGSFILDHGDLNYLNGLMDAGVRDAATLVDAINQNHEIEVWLEQPNQAQLIK